MPTARKPRIVALLWMIGALLTAGTTAHAAPSKPAGMSNAAYRALMLRSQALNQKDHLGAFSKGQQGTAPAYHALALRSQALNQKYHLGSYSPASQGITAPAYRALLLRSEALNKKYHLGAFAPAARVGTVAAGFSWSAFGFGAAATLGLVLLASVAIVVGRRGWRTPRPRISS